jgi:mannosyltransferase OCH1-like enzyme
MIDYYKLVFIFIIILLFITISIYYLHPSNTPPPLEPSKKNRVDTIIEKLNAGEQMTVQSIPKIIIQIWVQKDGGPPKIPQEHAIYMNHIRELNPDYQHLFFTQEDIVKFFESNYPEYYTTYKLMPTFIQKLDFFRYLAVYHYGGFYFDLDVNLNKPLDESIRNHHAVFPIDEYGDSEAQRFEDTNKYGRPFLLGQYAFGTVAKHPFLKFVVDKIHNKIHKYIQVHQKINKSNKDNMHYYVFKSTGPDFITDCYNEFNRPYLFHILSNGKRQMFGDYGSHMYSGTWK